MNLPFSIGTKVRSLRDFSDVPKGTIGYVIDAGDESICVAWDLPDRPYPHDKSAEEIRFMYAVNPGCPLRDWFNIDRHEQRFLEVIP